MVPGTASLKSMRQVQRQNSLGLHGTGQARYRHGHCGGSRLGHPTPGTTSTSSTDGHDPLMTHRHAASGATPRRSLHRLHYGTKTLNEYNVRGNARIQAALQDELIIAHSGQGAGVLTNTEASGDPAPEPDRVSVQEHDQLEAAVRRGTSLRLDQVMVHKPPRMDLTHDYEVIPSHARIIALPEDTTSSSGCGPTSALSLGDSGPSSFLHPPRQGSDADHSSASEEEEDWELLGMDDEVTTTGPRLQPQARTWASIVSRV